MEAPTQEKYRVQFDFTEDALRTLDRIKERLGVSTRAEVIRYALRVLGWVLEQLDADAKILVEKDNNAQQAVFPFLQREAKSSRYSSKAG